MKKMFPFVLIIVQQSTIGAPTFQQIPQQLQTPRQVQLPSGMPMPPQMQAKQQAEILSQMKLSNQALSPQQIQLLQQLQTQKQSFEQAHPAISSKTINLFYDIRFQNDLKNMELLYNNFRPLLEDFKKQIINFSEQPIAAQQNYTLFENILAPFEQIRQKPLTIAIVKALQYKSVANKSTLSIANNLIENLYKLIFEIEDILQKVAMNAAWATTFFNPNHEIIPHASIAEVFHDLLLTKFPLRVKKITRAVINWKAS